MDGVVGLRTHPGNRELRAFVERMRAALGLPHLYPWAFLPAQRSEAERFNVRTYAVRPTHRSASIDGAEFQ